MKWPSARFFQSIGLAGFSIGVYNAVSGYSQRHKNIENVQNINKNFQQVNDAIEKIAENYSNGNPQLKAQIIEQIHKKIEIKINNTHNPLRENLDIMNNAIVDYFKIQAEITTKSFNSQFIIDPHTKMQLQNEILSLQSQASGKIVVIHDTISSINPNLYVAKSQIEEIINEMRRNGNNFTDSIYKYIDNFNHYMASLNYEQNIAIINLFGIFVIIVSLISIVFIFYGNIILDYLNLELKYPKIAKFIVLRRKFQQFYLFWNIFVITIVSIIMFLMNLSILF